MKGFKVGKHSDACIQTSFFLQFNLCLNPMKNVISPRSLTCIGALSGQLQCIESWVLSSIQVQVSQPGKKHVPNLCVFFGISEPSTGFICSYSQRSQCEEKNAANLKQWRQWGCSLSSFQKFIRIFQTKKKHPPKKRHCRLTRQKMRSSPQNRFVCSRWKSLYENHPSSFRDPKVFYFLGCNCFLLHVV